MLRRLIPTLRQLEVRCSYWTLSNWRLQYLCSGRTNTNFRGVDVTLTSDRRSHWRTFEPRVWDLLPTALASLRRLSSTAQLEPSLPRTRWSSPGKCNLLPCRKCPCTAAGRRSPAGPAFLHAVLSTVFGLPAQEAVRPSTLFASLSRRTRSCWRSW